jgi:hypothetical protein
MNTTFWCDKAGVNADKAIEIGEFGGLTLADNLVYCTFEFLVHGGTVEASTSVSRCVHG